MMFNPPSRMKLPTSLIGLAAVVIVSAIALSTPASAAKQKDVVAACKAMGPRCALFPGVNGGVGGCTSLVCFTCTKGKCVQSRVSSNGGGSKSKPGAGDTIGKLISPSGTRANDTLIHRDNTALVKFGTPSNNHERMGGRH